MVFMLEGFCGHGFRRDDPEGPCDRGPGAEAWFDLTGIHPSPEGHRALADMFTAVVEE
jgi:lysophospholipase L1-like esterase